MSEMTRYFQVIEVEGEDPCENYLNAFETKNVHEAIRWWKERGNKYSFIIEYDSAQVVAPGDVRLPLFQGSLDAWEQRVTKFLYPGRETKYIVYQYSSEDEKMRIEYEHDALALALVFAQQVGYGKNIYKEEKDGTVVDGDIAFWNAKIIEEGKLLTPAQIAEATVNETWMLTSLMSEDAQMGVVQQALVNFAHAIQRRSRQGS